MGFGEAGLREAKEGKGQAGGSLRGRQEGLKADLLAKGSCTSSAA